MKLTLEELLFKTGQIHGTLMNETMSRQDRIDKAIKLLEEVHQKTLEENQENKEV